MLAQRGKSSRHLPTGHLVLITTFPTEETTWGSSFPNFDWSFLCSFERDLVGLESEEIFGFDPSERGRSE